MSGLRSVPACIPSSLPLERRTVSTTWN